MHNELLNEPVSIFNAFTVVKVVDDVEKGLVGLQEQGSRIRSVAVVEGRPTITSGSGRGVTCCVIQKNIDDSLSTPADINVEVAVGIVHILVYSVMMCAPSQGRVEEPNNGGAIRALRAELITAFTQEEGSVPVIPSQTLQVVGCSTGSTQFNARAGKVAFGFASGACVCRKEFTEPFIGVLQQVRAVLVRNQDEQVVLRVSARVSLGQLGWAWHCSVGRDGQN